jgi:hypothetical protein
LSPTGTRLGSGLFLGLVMFYVGTAPGRIQETYATENLEAARAFLDRGSMRVPQPWSGGRPSYPRHGIMESVLDIPFVLAARLATSGDPAAEEWLVSLIPSIFTAFLIAVLCLWCADLGATPSRALAVSLTAALGTMLWPYTAIGLEPTFSASALAAGYSIFVFGRRGGAAWPLIAGLTGGLAAGLKETGLLVLPALALLFAETWFARPGRKWWLWLLFGLPIVASLCCFATTRQEAFEAIMGGSLGRSAAVSGWQMLFGVWGQMASPNKGLVFYAPVAILGLMAWPDLNRRAGRVARWVLLLALTTIVGMGTRYFWADETWGPRYDHVLLAPFMLGLAVVEVRPRLLRFWQGAWALAAVFGLFVAVLGQLFWYGHLAGVMQRAHANELNRILYDPTWNPIEFHARLLEYRLGIGDPTFRPPGRWWFTGPALEDVYVGDVARFEPLILYDGGPPRGGGRVVPGARRLHLLAFGAGLAVIGLVVVSTLGARSRHAPAVHPEA